MGQAAKDADSKQKGNMYPASLRLATAIKGGKYGKSTTGRTMALWSNHSTGESVAPGWAKKGTFGSDKRKKVLWFFSHEGGISTTFARKKQFPCLSYMEAEVSS